MQETTHFSESPLECRVGCGACCIAPSISSPIPGMPNGKPAGVRCIQLTSDNRCALFGRPERPVVCVRLRPTQEMCGETDTQALAYLTWLESATHTEDKWRTKFANNLSHASPTPSPQP